MNTLRETDGTWDNCEDFIHGFVRRMQSAPSEEARLLIGSSSDPESCSYTWADVQALPPLRTPMKRHAQDARIFVALSLWMLFYATSLIPTITADPRWRGVLWSEAAAILTCFLGFLARNPSTVLRSPETCFPQPTGVAARLRDGLDFDGMDNVTEDGRVFCVRCLVWRPEGVRTHHCSACERCAVDFDHHCFVYGRCVAGRCCRGNLGLFRALCLLTACGLATLAAAPKGKRAAVGQYNVTA